MCHRPHLEVRHDQLIIDRPAAMSCADRTSVRNMQCLRPQIHRWKVKKELEIWWTCITSRAGWIQPGDSNCGFGSICWSQAHAVTWQTPPSATSIYSNSKRNQHFFKIKFKFLLSYSNPYLSSSFNQSICWSQAHAVTWKTPPSATSISYNSN